RSTLALADALPRLQLDASENLLVFVDQFEELFRYRGLSRASSEDEALHFVSLLLEVTSRADLPAFVVLTMRSDFLGECGQYPALATAINRGQYLVSLLNRGQRERAIVGPLRTIGVGIEPRLLHLVQAEARDKLDQLPLLEHALMRTFDEWRQRPHSESDPGLTEDDYVHAGGMAHALSKHANEAYDSLSPEHQALAEQLFRALTERREDGRAVRRPCRVAEITASVPTTLADVKTVIEAFQGDHRHFIIVRPQTMALGESSELDIAHESLMRVWDRLARWTQREVDDAAQLHRLSESLALNRKGATGLLRDPELALALKWRDRARPSLVWAARYGVDLNDIEGFLQRSTHEHAKERAEEARTRLDERDRERAEFERTRRQNRRLFIVALTAVVALVLVGVITAAYAVQRQSLAWVRFGADLQAQTAHFTAWRAAIDRLTARWVLSAEKQSAELATKAARYEAKVARAEADALRLMAAESASASSTARLTAQLAHQRANVANDELVTAKKSLEKVQKGLVDAQKSIARVDAERAKKDAELVATKAELQKLEFRRKKLEGVRAPQPTRGGGP
ncbi:MAG TPA: hypothetical protein VG755_34345, partial [Nannocystaceae bacterium]|nr:hypothetical protein [Nannocystaceae bacterium]